MTFSIIFKSVRFCTLHQCHMINPFISVAFPIVASWKKPSAKIHKCKYAFNASIPVLLLPLHTFFHKIRNCHFPSPTLSPIFPGSPAAATSLSRRCLVTSRLYAAPPGRRPGPGSNSRARARTHPRAWESAQLYRASAKVISCYPDFLWFTHLVVWMYLVVCMYT